MKKLVAFLCMLICILSMTGCSKTETTDYTANYDQEALKDTTEQFFCHAPERGRYNDPEFPCHG